MFSIAFSSLFGQDAARDISGEAFLRATSTRYYRLALLGLMAAVSAVLVGVYRALRG